MFFMFCVSRKHWLQVLTCFWGRQALWEADTPWHGCSVFCAAHVLCLVLLFLLLVLLVLNNSSGGGGVGMFVWLLERACSLHLFQSESDVIKPHIFPLLPLLAQPHNTPLCCSSQMTVLHSSTPQPVLSHLDKQLLSPLCRPSHFTTKLAHFFPFCRSSLANLTARCSAL